MLLERHKGDACFFGLAVICRYYLGINDQPQVFEQERRCAVSKQCFSRSDIALAPFDKGNVPTSLAY